MSAVTCNTCGAEVDEASGLPLEERKPCPTCGGMTRMIEVGATISISTAASATGIVVHAETIKATGTAHDPTIVTTSGPIERAVTTKQHLCELIWDAPTEDGAPSMLRVYVGGELVDTAFQAGDSFGLLMELADDGAILPPWADREDEG